MLLERLWAAIRILIFGVDGSNHHWKAERHHCIALELPPPQIIQ